jgi:formylglycine-generating enzyme required for sulfatase activity
MVHLPAVAGQPGFFLSRTQVTDDQYQRVMGTRPAGGVTYDEAVTYCKRLSDLEGRKPGYRLPTQKEWDDAVKLDREPVAGAPLFHIGDPPAEWIADQKDPARRRGLRVARSE